MALGWQAFVSSSPIYGASWLMLHCSAGCPSLLSMRYAGRCKRVCPALAASGGDAEAAGLQKGSVQH